MIADDNEHFRQAVTMFLETRNAVDVVAQAVDGRDVLKQMDAARPDIICMDINMNRLDGVETTRQLLLRQPEVKVIGLSANFDLLRITEMFRAGARGYVVKSSVGSDLANAIDAVNQGRTYISPELGISDVTDLA